MVRKKKSQFIFQALLSSQKRYGSWLSWKAVGPGLLWQVVRCPGSRSHGVQKLWWPGSKWGTKKRIRELLLPFNNWGKATLVRSTSRAGPHPAKRYQAQTMGADSRTPGDRKRWSTATSSPRLSQPWYSVVEMNKRRMLVDPRTLFCPPSHCLEVQMTHFSFP